MPRHAKLHRTRVEVRASKWVPTEDGRGHTSRPNGTKAGDATLFIDLEALTRHLGERALHNTSGKAQLADGLIVVVVDSVTRQGGA